ncbi:hypothetical protein VIGAN_06003200 [Vigna angularis var. angularis]|uniref:Uncharacterized protein n=1 Tax=Vigna angularis var. angularis TaxID=157739 RepID=A0A0S3S8I8_PHAAN|nr:hypothetical protein VIGAN_06003200 [Vigna angularis var. angularis]
MFDSGGGKLRKAERISISEWQVSFFVLLLIHGVRKRHSSCLWQTQQRQSGGDYNHSKHAIRENLVLSPSRYQKRTEHAPKHHSLSRNRCCSVPHACRKQLHHEYQKHVKSSACTEKRCHCKPHLNTFTAYHHTHYATYPTSY